jgi:hypothetical protein
LEIGGRLEVDGMEGLGLVGLRSEYVVYLQAAVLYAF